MINGFICTPEKMFERKPRSSGFRIIGSLLEITNFAPWMKRAIQIGSSIIRKWISSYAWTGYSAL